MTPEEKAALDKLKTATVELEAVMNKPAPVPTPTPYAGPGKFSYSGGKLANVAAPYVVHFGEWQLPQTIADKKAIIKLIHDMNVWNGVTILCHWKETNAIPAYIQSLKLNWWADTLNLAYLALPYSDYVAYIVKIFNVYGAVGGVLDDCQNFTDAQMSAMCKPLLDMGKPVIASYGGTFDVKTKHPSVVNKISIAWQLYYKRTGTTVPAGKQVTDMLATRGRCDVANLDAYSNGGIVPSATDVAAMFAACQAAGVRNHQPYASWNSDGWNWLKEANLVAALKAGMIAFWQSSGIQS